MPLLFDDYLCALLIEVENGRYTLTVFRGNTDASTMAAFVYRFASGIRRFVGYGIITTEIRGLSNGNIDMGLGISYGWPCTACGAWHVCMKPCSGCG